MEIFNDLILVKIEDQDIFFSYLRQSDTSEADQQIQNE